ncbi:septum site-determining protein MinD [Synechococcus sp. BA-132 BA5]|nr:septum site-determining protein MinD [Synechococcus sp. BA-132 BA5]MEA5413708.1 septum site-determining protein MinD [Synechococcus sp. BA-132 BA5]
MTSAQNRTILICSGKGSVGKTTLTANLGIALAKQGALTAVLDADFGLRNLDLLLGLENRIVYTAQDVLSGSCRLEQALVKHEQEPNLSLLPAGNPRMLELLTPDDMKKIAGLLAEQFEYVLIDCPAGIEDGFKNAAAACREAIVVTTPEVSAVRDADRVIGLLQTRQIEPIQLVLNRVRPRMMANQEMLSVSDITDILALPLLGLVQEDDQVIISTNRGEPLMLNGTRSPAGQAYTNVARRLRGEEVPLVDPTSALSQRTVRGSAKTGSVSRNAAKSAVKAIKEIRTK